MKRGANDKAKPGKTTALVLEAIKKFEQKQLDWEIADLSKVCGISTQHAHNIVVRLTFHGLLQYAEVTVKKRRLVLTRPLLTVAAQA